MFENNIEMSDLMKNCPVDAEVFHVNGRTDVQIDMTDLIVACHTFANEPENCVLLVSGGPFC
jgi:hypothetical protein